MKENRKEKDKLEERKNAMEDPGDQEDDENEILE